MFRIHVGLRVRPLGCSAWGRIEKDPSRLDSPSSAAAEIDLLKDCQRKIYR